MIFVNIYFYLGNSIIGLIPDFAGYILISSGIKECIEEKKSYKHVQNFAFAACIFSAVIWCMDLFTVSSNLYANFGVTWGYVLKAVSIVFTGIVTYLLIDIFDYAGSRMNYVFDIKVLKISWLLNMLLNCLMLICSNMVAVYSWIALGQVLTTIWFLIMLYLAFEKAFEVSKGKKL